MFSINLAQAQESNLSAGGVSPHWEFGATTGTSIPSDTFEGVTELLPSVLITMDKGFEYFRIETKYLFASSEGVRLRRIYMVIKNYFNLFDMQYYWNFGLGVSQYKRNTNIFNDEQYLTSGGWHYALGSKIKINKKVFFKAELGSYIRPSRTIYVGIGLGFNFGGESK
ncbi:MAG: hypothetical protein KDD58_05055 [Bdellovibrionales bacterium]|nr:hypothetical protein [Bdellovibrionales bacterium]